MEKEDERITAKGGCKGVYVEVPPLLVVGLALQSFILWLMLIIITTVILIEDLFVMISNKRP